MTDHPSNERFTVDQTPDPDDIERIPATERANKMPPIAGAAMDPKKVIGLAAAAGAVMFTVLALGSGITGNSALPVVKPKPALGPAQYDPNTVIAPTLAAAASDPNAPIALTATEVPPILGQSATQGAPPPPTPASASHATSTPPPWSGSGGSTRRGRWARCYWDCNRASRSAGWSRATSPRRNGCRCWPKRSTALDCRSSAIAALEAEPRRRGYPSTSHWTGAAIIAQCSRTKTGIVGRGARGPTAVGEPPTRQRASVGYEVPSPARSRAARGSFRSLSYRSN